MDGPGRRPIVPGRVSVAQGMILVALLALCFAALRSATLLLSVANLLVLAGVCHLLLVERAGKVCPTCGERGLGRVAMVPFGHQFFRCTHCGARWKRTAIGPWWWPAKGPADDAVYRRKAEEGRWVGAPAVVEESGPQGQLLHEKRHREPVVEPGLAPELEPGWIGPTAAEGPPPVELEPFEAPGRLLEGKVRRAARRIRH